GGMARHFTYLELEVLGLQTHLIALAQRMGQPWDALLGGAVYGHRMFFYKLCDTADMIGVVMRRQDSGKLKLLLFQKAQDRIGIAWIDHADASFLRIVQHPDVVVTEGPEGKCWIYHG